MNSKLFKKKCIFLIIFPTIFFLFFYNIFLIYANQEKKEETNFYEIDEQKISSNQKNKILKQIFVMKKDIFQLEEQLIFAISKEGTIHEVKKDAEHYLKGYFLKNFKLRLKILKNKFENKIFSEENEKILIENFNMLLSEFKQIKKKINEFIKNLFKQDISLEDFNKRLNYILSDKVNEPSSSEYITLRENILKNKYQNDNKNALHFEKDLEEYNEKINVLKSKQMLYENKLKELTKDLEKLLIQDINSQKELDYKEKENYEIKMKNLFSRHPKYIKIQKELKKLYIKRQQIIQSIGSVKTEVEKTKCELSHCDTEIQKLKKEYEKKGEMFTALFGKLNPKFKNINRFKKNPELDIKNIESQLKEIFNIVKI